MEVGFSTWVAILGFVLTCLQIYFPRVSVALDQKLNSLWGTIKFLDSHIRLLSKDTRKLLSRFFTWLMYGRLGIISFLSALLAIVSIAVFDTDVKNTSQPSTWLFFSLMAPWFVYGGLLVFFVLFTLVALSSFYLHIIPFVFLVNKIFHILNVIGRGKAIGGIGILLAGYGLYSAQWGV